METSTVGGGKMLGHDVMAQATFTAEMRPDGSWLGECPNAGIIFCSEGVATFRANGVGNMTESGGVAFRGGASFETTTDFILSRYCKSPRKRPFLYIHKITVDITSFTIRVHYFKSNF